MKDITEKEYREYLISLKDTVFKILPLYEERNEHLDEYMDSLICFELIGAKEGVEVHPYQMWYVKTLNTLRGIRKFLIGVGYPYLFLEDDSIEIDMVTTSLINAELADNHRRIRREILKTTALIDKQIDQLKGE